MRWLALLAIVAGCASCRKEPRGAAPQSVENRVDAGAVSRPAPDAGPDACVQACVKSNQMRAVSIEQIEADCRAQCATDASAP
jgi:hypothetical protein